MSTPRVALVVAMAENRVIGKGGTLPWRIPEDMKWFREITMGKPCIMGRKTWESLPKRPLPGRTNIVVTRDRGYSAEGAVTVTSLDDAIALVNSSRFGNTTSIFTSDGRSAREYSERIEVGMVGVNIGVAAPMAHTMAPGLSHLPQRIGCGELVRARTTSESETASSAVVTRAPISAANCCA